MVNLIVEVNQGYVISFNINKIKLMIISKKQIGRKQLFIWEQQTEKIQKYRYLGHGLMKTGKI